VCARNDSHKAHTNTWTSYSSLLRVQRLTLQHTATHCNTLQQHTATSRCTRNKEESDIQVFVCALCVSFWAHTNTCCCSVLLQCVVAVCCCSVLLQCVVAVCCCSVLLQCVVAVCCSVSRCTRKNEEYDVQVFMCALGVSFKKYLYVLFLVLTSAAAHTAAHCNNTLQQHKYLCVPKMIRTNHIQILEYLIPRYHE